MYCTDINSKSKRVGETIKLTGCIHESKFDVGSGRTIANPTISTIPMFKYNSTVLLTYYSSDFKHYLVWIVFKQ